MQFKLVSALAFATLAAATVTPVRRGGGGSSTIPASQCNTGDLQCCNSVQAGDSDAVSSILGLLGIVLQDVTALVGLNCSPLSVIGIGGNSCTAQPVCCTNNSFHGLVALGCTPVNINL
ncbi:sc3 hydrophobin [Psilocybe cubensis]|uniref:Sc3 hydrophobin n=2 Tax=Psilocybe cubensis TaxID=181762 RepID=A0ACB8GPS7_PSICU|nr:sc3 hydrophobin [Psilocybe cubensis]KAH9477480.1 sc3 hydrophobin [Psilocybe cubensis]